TSHQKSEVPEFTQARKKTRVREIKILIAYWTRGRDWPNVLTAANRASAVNVKLRIQGETILLQQALRTTSIIRPPSQTIYRCLKHHQINQVFKKKHIMCS
ncbi:Hypothetical predicted protein, partial [Olea europaea subsp. europaea]